MQFRLGIELQAHGDAEAVAQRCGQKPHPRRGAHQREGLQFDPHGARGGAFADDEVELEILERGIEHFLDRRIEAVDLVDEEHVARFEIGQDRGQIARPRQHRAGGHAEVHAKLARHDLREGRLAQTRGAMEQRVIHRLAPLAGRLQEDAQVRPRLGLTDEIVKRLGAQRAVIVFGQRLGAQGGVGACHVTPGPEA